MHSDLLNFQFHVFLLLLPYFVINSIIRCSCSTSLLILFQIWLLLLLILWWWWLLLILLLLMWWLLFTINIEGYWIIISKLNWWCYHLWEYILAISRCNMILRPIYNPIHSLWCHRLQIGSTWTRCSKILLLVTFLDIILLLVILCEFAT